MMVQDQRLTKGNEFTAHSVLGSAADREVVAKSLMVAG